MNYTWIADIELLTRKAAPTPGKNLQPQPSQEAF